MAIYDIAKDVASLIKDIPNAEIKIELQQKIIDIQSQALELQAENEKLKKRIDELEDNKEMETKIEWHPDGYFTLKDDNKGVKYCGTCWGEKKNCNPLSPGHRMLHCSSCKKTISR